MASGIVFFLLFVLQFVVLPFGASHYEVPKVIIAEIGILYLSVQTISFKFFRGTNLYSNQTLIIGLGVVSLLTVLVHHSDVSFLGNTFRLQGTFLFWLLLLFAWVSSFIPLPSFSKVTYLFLLAGLVVSMFSGVMTLDGRSVGMLGEPNALAAAAIFLWPWLLTTKPIHTHASGVSLNRVSIVGAGILLSLFIIMLAGSKSGLVALCIQLVILLGGTFLSLKKATVLGLLLLMISLIYPLQDHQTVYENRGEIWKTAVVAGFEHPLLGWGFGNVEVAMKIYNQKLYNNLRGYYVDSAHNIFLDFWVEGGMVGLTGLVSLLLLTSKQFVGKNNSQSIILLVGLLAVLSFNPGSIVSLLQFWWLIGRGVFTQRQS